MNPESPPTNPALPPCAGSAFLCSLQDTLCEVAQLLDGWHQDGTAWSEWDESVRQKVLSIVQHVEVAVKRRAGITDVDRMDWLTSMAVEVRVPLVYGSRAMFHAQTVSEDYETHRTSLREQIDAAMISQNNQDQRCAASAASSVQK